MVLLSRISVCSGYCHAASVLPSAGVAVDP
jgi:hypothetical protein